MPLPASSSQEWRGVRKGCCETWYPLNAGEILQNPDPRLQAVQACKAQQTWVGTVRPAGAGRAPCEFTSGAPTQRGSPRQGRSLPAGGAFSEPLGQRPPCRAAHYPVQAPASRHRGPSQDLAVNITNPGPGKTGHGPLWGWVGQTDRTSEGEAEKNKKETKRKEKE